MGRTATRDLGLILKEGRRQRELSQADVARLLGLQSPQSISDWERNHGSMIPVRYLKKLIKIYGLSEPDVFEAILDYQWSKLEQKISKEFYGKASSGSKRR